jgi:AraC-like DNA-binding protein
VTIEPKAIISDWKDSSIWSTQRLPAERQFDRWCDFVNEAHLHWSIRREPYDIFPAFIREGRFGDFRMASLTAAQSRVKGTRSCVEIAQDAEVLYNIIYIVDGSECLIIDGREIDLRPGNFVLWDSARPMTFITGENLHQVTLSVTHDRLHRVFPQAGDFVGKPLSAATGLNRLFANHLLSLDEQFGELPCDQAQTVLDATINFLAATLDSANCSADSACTSELLRKIRRYIDRNLEDFDLSISRIAVSHGISIRHLHRLFQGLDTSVATYIVKHRLDRCKHELSSSFHSRASITDIAFRWGFADSGTFSKAFRREFGMTPRDFRAIAKAQGAVNTTAKTP